jgi:hypothetical protein
MYARALEDKSSAARYLAALFRGETSDEADAGALLIADALQTIRAFGTVHIKWEGSRD